MPLRRRPDATGRLKAVLALPEGQESCPALLAAVGDPSLDVARAALQRLVRVGCAREAEALRERLFTVDIGLVPDCARTLRALGDRESAAVASARLSDPLPATRKTAALALRELAEPSARGALCVALADTNASVRASVVDALARLPADDATLTAVAELLHDADPVVRAAAVDALARLATTPDSCLAGIVADPSSVVRRHLARAAGRLGSPLVAALAGDPDADVRADLADALAACRCSPGCSETPARRCGATPAPRSSPQETPTPVPRWCRRWPTRTWSSVNERCAGCANCSAMRSSLPWRQRCLQLTRDSGECSSTHCRGAIQRRDRCRPCHFATIPSPPCVSPSLTPSRLPRMRRRSPGLWSGLRPTPTPTFATRRRLPSRSVPAILIVGGLAKRATISELSRDRDGDIRDGLRVRALGIRGVPIDTLQDAGRLTD
jgi:hypothetical protein